MQQLRSTLCAAALTAVHGTISEGCLCPFCLHAPLFHLYGLQDLNRSGQHYVLVEKPQWL